jgi:hypothetical protein
LLGGESRQQAACSGGSHARREFRWRNEFAPSPPPARSARPHLASHDAARHVDRVGLLARPHSACVCARVRQTRVQLTASLEGCVPAMCWPYTAAGAWWRGALRRRAARARLALRARPEGTACGPQAHHHARPVALTRRGGAEARDGPGGILRAARKLAPPRPRPRRPPASVARAAQRERKAVRGSATKRSACRATAEQLRARASCPRDGVRSRPARRTARAESHRTRAPPSPRRAAQLRHRTFSRASSLP